MVHLFEFSSAQWILITAGALFQAGAYFIFYQDCAHAHASEEALKAREKVEAETARRKEAARESSIRSNSIPKVVRYRRQIEGVMEHVSEDVRPADLLRTAKVRFKHSLEAYQGETQAMPPRRRSSGASGGEHPL